jgi:hypothetical protein
MYNKISTLDEKMKDTVDPEKGDTVNNKHHDCITTNGC